MNLLNGVCRIRRLAFRGRRFLAGFFPGGRISAFGAGDRRVGKILIVNLDRQPHRLQRTLRELSRFHTEDASPLCSIAQRLSAVDARDGRAIAATADVDSHYCVGDQLYVQPDRRLAECFDVSTPVKMTRQEVAVARSHIEAWKAIAVGPDNYVLVLEDDVWFQRNAAAAIDRGWRAALRRCRAEGGPHLLYLSYDDAGGTVERADVCDALFTPKRGLWFLSGYVLSREGASILLRAMPVVGPVDMWMNYRFKKLGALALSSPAILQRQDSSSENSYSILPFLARAGIVDTRSGLMAPEKKSAGTVLAWTAGSEHEGLSMALSMLGFRVRAFDGDEKPIVASEFEEFLQVFDALVDVPLAPDALSAAIARADTTFLFESETTLAQQIGAALPSSSRTVLLSADQNDGKSWKPICAALGLTQPVEAFPVGVPRGWRTFRDDRPPRRPSYDGRESQAADDSPWVLPSQGGWEPTILTRRRVQRPGACLLQATMMTETSFFTPLVETFPGNLASFKREAFTHDEHGARLVISKVVAGNRPYRSAAFASRDLFQHGRFEVELRAARGSGIVTGFFLHRASPRQEIDIELSGGDPQRMLVNVYFNPGDEGTEMGFGYRGSPFHIDLGFDATAGFHYYAIDWRPECIAWSVDGTVIHERVGWDPTPIPHLPMRLHANLWAPRSEELAGPMDEDALPTDATFRNVSVWT